MSGKNNPMYGKSHSKENRDFFSKTRSGAMNPMSGKMWICNFELEQSKVWDMNKPLPNGWQKGRYTKQKLIRLKQKMWKNE